ncbi:MAG: MFS transporter [Betaproteobacteria bacterium]
MLPLRVLFLRITLPLSAFNLVNQGSRAVMAVVGPVLAVEFGLTASELGFLAACMFVSYAIVQLPVGIALDMVGPRKVQSGLALLAAAGFAVFALAEGFVGMAVARVMLGVGVSAGLMALIKANAQWFPTTRVAAMTGWGLAIGTLGAVLATAPAEAALPYIGWRGIFWLMGGFSVAAALWMFFAMPEKAAAPAAQGKGKLADETRVMGTILASPVFWRFGPAMAMLSVLNFTYLGLWVGPWLRDVAGYDGPARAATLFLYTLTMMGGGLTMGLLSSRAQERGFSGTLVPLACLGGLILVQLALALQPSGALAVNGLWILFAFFGSAGALGYVAVGQMFPAEQMGRVATAANMLTLIGAFVLQAVIGWILDLWPRTAAGGWDPDGYSAAMLLSAVIQVAVGLRMAVAAKPWRRRA